MLNTLNLYKNKKEYLYIVLFLLLIFIYNISYKYYNYSNFIQEELYFIQAKILNIYKKNNYLILKLQDKNNTFFTSTNKKNFSKLDIINITILTKNINFYKYLSGFYTPSFNLQLKKNSNKSLIKKLSKNINTQHQNNSIKELFNALFLAMPLCKNLKTHISSFGVSHLVAISGFHLTILSFVIYWFLYIFYNKIHQNYFPYRNKKFDILIITSFILFFYLYFLGNIPSLLRSFVMYIFALFLLRNNIKLLSFNTLALVVLFIIALFPKLLFSLSLWFSVAGVFYIFLFLQYFKNINKYFAFLFFNIWIFSAMNPIIHYFFPTTSLMQLYSPILTLVFSIFYPLELFLHLINQGNLFDIYINIFLDIQVNTYDIKTPLSFFYTYIFVSFLSIKYKLFFILLNIMFIIFNIYIYTY